MPSSPAFLVTDTQDQAIAQPEEHGDDAVVVAGSTAITNMLKQGLIDPRLMVSLGRVDELRGNKRRQRTDVARGTDHPSGKGSEPGRAGKRLPIFDTEYEELPTIFSPDDALFPDFKSRERRYQDHDRRREAEQRSDFSP